MKTLEVKVQFKNFPLKISVPTDAHLDYQDGEVKKLTVFDKNAKGTQLAEFNYVEYYILDCDHVFFGHRVFNWFKNIGKKG